MTPKHPFVLFLPRHTCTSSLCTSARAPPPPLLPRSQEEKKSLKGHFDLRNVEKIEPVSGDDTVAAAGADAVNLWIAEEGKSTKVMTISFMDDAFKHRDAWLTLWCSAVGANGVAGPLASFVDPALTAELNERYGLAVAVSRQRSVFSKKLRITKILTPRGSSIEVPGPSTALDTTRGTAELPPPGAGVLTTMSKDPDVMSLLAGISASSEVALLNVVVRGPPSKYTSEADTKPVPVTVSVTCGEPPMTLSGAICVTVGGALTTLKTTSLLTPPPGGLVPTLRLSVPGTASLAVGSVALCSF
jgi:hypothetical protein